MYVFLSSFKGIQNPVDPGIITNLLYKLNESGNELPSVLKLGIRRVWASSLGENV